MRGIIDIVRFMTESRKKSGHIEDYFSETIAVCKSISKTRINDLAYALLELRKNEGRLFILGIGGSAANASHSVNDFRKLCGIESYAPTDNIAEFTARANDDGWKHTFQGYLKGSKLRKNDALLILSVGGGSENPPVSENIIAAIDCAKDFGSKIYGIVGKSNGYTAKNSDLCIIVPNVSSKHITPHCEEMQAIILHSLVSHPYLQLCETRW